MNTYGGTGTTNDLIKPLIDEDAKALTDKVPDVFPDCGGGPGEESGVSMVPGYLYAMNSNMAPVLKHPSDWPIYFLCDQDSTPDGAKDLVNEHKDGYVVEKVS